MNVDRTEPQRYALPAGVRIAFREDGPADDGTRCGAFWLGGFMSDMTGTKAQHLAALAAKHGFPCLRFDYSGHGASGGAFTDGTISRWLAEAMALFRERTRGRRVIVGSSMGGWLALLMVRALAAEAERIAGLVLIAPAVDMTRELLWAEMDAPARATLTSAGVWHRPSAYGDPYPITKALIEDGERHLLLNALIPVPCPVRILQGDRDADVPSSHAMRVFDALAGENVTLTLIKGGDHRLSRPEDLAILGTTVLDLIEREAG
jgi:pimeloyl-ACP methyl ester carboxylesterase